MAIQFFPPTVAGETAARAVADPKNLAFVGRQWEVRTGPDYIAPRALTPDEQDAETARSDAKLRDLAAMTPAQVQTWVTDNVTTMAQARDTISTLAIAVSVLARRL